MILREQHQVLATFLFRALPINVTGGVVTEWVGSSTGWAIESFDKTYKVAEWVVDQVLRLPTPGKFIALVQALDNRDGALDSLVEIANDLKAGRRAWEPFVSQPSFDWALDADPLAIRDGRPFVDRGGFRGLLPRQGAAASPACLVITGDAGGGKSYLHDFCEAFAAARQGFRVGHAKLGGSSAAQLDARTVARELSLGLGTLQKAIPPRHEELQRDAENLANWIARYTPVGPLPAVAILDEFGRAELAESVHRFIIELALRLQRDEQALARMRLVLIGYDEGRLAEEKIQFTRYVLEPVEEAHIADWFRKRFPDHEEYRYEDAARTIYQHAAESPPGQRMLVINQEIRAAAQEFV